ncbi:hypothetical protein CTEN210_02512 [Chaetoceros tenuissimus]|uniref:Uncharacterized protein n=1 Tax=Chaetoceros tenuissimus TaxID=426638 RepID=A0AAD3H0Y0_9STRA|nr:hypothetical protein CTEN210_02512 [Chaetoceros tenuissimus]
MNSDGKGNHGEHELELKYMTGIPTLRSATHRVRFSAEKALKNKNAPKPRRTDGDNYEKINDEYNGTMLPDSIRKVEHVPYDMSKYNLMEEVITMLKSLDEDVVGSFPEDKLQLEYFEVPQKSLTRKKQKGQCEKAQEYLSQAVASCTPFLDKFDSFVTEVILVHLKNRLIEENILKDGGEDDKVVMYYQRPPTIRIQCGPARASVKPHRDADYGHQPGELNYWVPLTNRHVTEVDLFVESEEGKEDYAPIESDLGFATSFHGSNCSHYVNANKTRFTRVSFDFRVGIEPFYDPCWEMIGTKDDHSRRKVLV